VNRLDLDLDRSHIQGSLEVGGLDSVHKVKHGFWNQEFTDMWEPTQGIELFNCYANR